MNQSGEASDKDQHCELNSSRTGTGRSMAGKPGRLIIFGLVVLMLGSCVSWDKEVRKALKESYGTDFPSYTFKAAPVGTFGVGTMYSDEIIEGKDINASWLLAHPNTWYVDTLSSEDRDKLNASIFEEGDFGTVEIKKDISSTLSLEASIPPIKEILGGGASIDYAKGVKVLLRATKAINRQMNYSEFIEAIDAGLIKDYVGRYLQVGNVLLGAKDIVLVGYSAEIKVDRSVNPTLHARLGAMVEKVVGDAALELSIDKIDENTFTATSLKPVVAAVLYVKPPRSIPRTITATRLSSEDWQEVVLSNRVLLPLEKLLIDRGMP